MSEAPFEPTGRRSIRRQFNRAIVAGFGPVGRIVADELERAGFAITVLDLNDRAIQYPQGPRRRWIEGDVTDGAALRRAGIGEADALILAIPDEDQALQACRVARALHPGIFIAARTNYLSKGMLCTQAGADAVVVEEVVTATAMGEAITSRLVEAPGDPTGD